MQQKGVVVFSDPRTGRFALLVEDTTYLLAEQLDGQHIRLELQLAGLMNAVGVESLTDIRNGNTYSAFIIAYGLSRGAVHEEFCWL